MDTLIRNVYLQEIRSQCEIAKQAIKDMGDLLPTASMREFIGEPAPRFWYCLQAFLAAAAIISKLLWPSRGGVARGLELRAVLSITDASPLHAHKLRDAFEHMDERLDEWAKAAESDGNLELNVRVVLPGPASLFKLDPKRCFLYFDGSAYTVTFGGNKHELLPISWAVHALADQVDAILGEIPS